jgi:hypothetical protein
MSDPHPLNGTYRWNDPGNPPAFSLIELVCEADGSIAGAYTIHDVIKGVVQEPYSLKIVAGYWQKLDKGVEGIETWQFGFLLPTNGTQPGNEITVDAWAGWASRFSNDRVVPVLHCRVAYCSDQGGTPDPAHPNKVTWLGVTGDRMYGRVPGRG